MKRRSAAAFAVLLIIVVFHSAVCATARAAEPFPVIPLPEKDTSSHVLAYVTLGVGAALVGGSFALAARAEDRYADYLGATSPETIARLYDETRRYDRLASASILTGEALLALGIHLRFLRLPVGDVRFACGPNRCDVSLRF